MNGMKNYIYADGTQPFQAIKIEEGFENILGIIKEKDTNGSFFRSVRYPEKLFYFDSDCCMNEVHPGDYLAYNAEYDCEEYGYDGLQAWNMQPQLDEGSIIEVTDKASDSSQ